MTRSILIPFLALAASAQTSLTVSGPATARPGTAVNLSLTLSGNTSVALSWTLKPPTGYTEVGAIGAAGTAANKTLYCTTDATLCLLVGATPAALNNTAIAPGVIATYAVQVPGSAAAGSASFPLSGLMAVDAAGSSVSITSGPGFSLTVLAKSDINGDGKTDAADVQLMIQQTLAGTCSNDQNGDGRCDLLDVMIVLLKAMGIG